MTPILRQMRAEELPGVLDWAAAEGWHPGLDDAAPFLAADAQGFFVAEAEGEPVAAISVVNHAPGHAFLGLYICHPDWRGRGLGLALFTHALAHAGERCIGLDGVAAQEANYARSGFLRAGSTTRLEGQPRALIAAEADFTPDHGLSEVREDDIPALIALDAAATGYARPDFLRAWLQPTATRRSLVSASRDGFCTIRRCKGGEGVKIGPVIAPDAGLALHLVRAALALMPADRVWIDVPCLEAPFAQRLTAAGFAPVFTTARIYRGTGPQSSAALHAIATMELG